MAHICKDNNQVVIMDATICAMNLFRDGMAGEFGNAGVVGDKGAMEVPKDTRSEIEG